MGNVLIFPECIFPLAVGVFLCFCAVCVYFQREGSPWIRYPAAGLLLICCTAVYQQFLTIFIVYGLLLTALELIRSEQTTAKKAIPAYVVFIAFVGVCTGVYYAAGAGIQKAASIGSNPRAAFTLQSILDNIKYYLTHQRSILRGKGIFKTALLRRCFCALAVIWAACAAIWLKRTGIKLKNVLILLAFPAAYASVFLLGIISDTDGVRVIMALFSIFALLSVSSLAFAGDAENKALVLCLSALLLVVFSMNTYGNVRISHDLTAVNTAEIALTRQYLHEIESYEAESGNTVKTVVFGRDADSEGRGNNAYAADWGVAGIFDFVSGGRTFEARHITEEEQARYFGEDADWTVYEPAEQLVFEGDTLYVCVY